MTLPDRQRAVITGYYAGFHTTAGWQELSPIHDGLRELCEGCSHPIDKPSTAQMTQRLAGTLQQAQLSDGRQLQVSTERIAISFSASKNRFTSLTTAEQIDAPLWCDWPAQALARHTGAAGPVMAPVAACATGAHAIAVGSQLIEDGYADVVLAGSMEWELSPLAMAGYRSLGALSRNLVMRPFDRRRDGFVPAEGAGCLVLESEAHAQVRGAEIYARVAGWSMQADACHPTVMEMNGDTIARAIEVAMRKADLGSVDYINAHGTATKVNDVTETRGIVGALGKQVPVSSTKPMTGHSLGAAGAVEAVISLLAIREGFIPPTLNLEESDNECELDYVPLTGRSRAVDSVLSLSYGFGGHIGALILQKCP